MTALVNRQAGRVLAMDETGAVLLFHGSDPADPAAGSWWLTPGGGIEPGESFAEAARREFKEETGFVAGDMGEPVHHRTAEFDFDGVRFLQVEQYFLIRVPRFDIDAGAWTDVEVRSTLDWGWFTPDEMDALPQLVYPRELADLIRRLR